ncbi:MBL fold metallo-hydrolase [Actinomycetospora cinnamomea]|uniref:L-ascorbate metabolism protein UlaG (Beta-lactamase superfamily) n=1 Tax=Actinomycetospora cinnamomea TaxID=663609 RepID=A0A2U1FLC2_9PSEU|nr:MBL fold metallo-hydrolase [Actinomycetospora cinnamomea]PVZ12959.1 L-ascorbate metabolism protein UlaG (beta-lactamase superfamily) [Actinomycetospora cinnamomea]
MIDGRPSLTFIGTATTLLRCAGFTVLTDPNFLHRGQRAYLGYGLWSKRLTEPAMTPGELPGLDAVVLSHLHGDHWDRVARRGLDRSLPIITTPAAARTLQSRQRFRRAIGLQTWEHHTLLGADGATLRVTALPGIHSPRPLTRLLPPVMGSLLEFADPGGEVVRRIYLSGDTLPFEGIAAIREHVGEVDRAVLHLGGTTLPGGLVVTMDGRMGADVLETMAPRRATPIHYDDYTVFRSPLSDFLAEVERRGWDDRVDVVHRGGQIPL